MRGRPDCCRVVASLIAVPPAITGAFAGSMPGADGDGLLVPSTVRVGVVRWTGAWASVHEFVRKLWTPTLCALATWLCQRPRRVRPRAYLPRPRDREFLAYFEEPPRFPRDCDTLAPRARPALGLVLPRFAETLLEPRDFARDFGEASIVLIGRSAKTKVRQMAALSFLSLIGSNNIILNLVLMGLCGYPMRVLLVPLRKCVLTLGRKRAASSSISNQLRRAHSLL